MAVIEDVFYCTDHVLMANNEHDVKSGMNCNTDTW